VHDSTRYSVRVSSFLIGFKYCLLLKMALHLCLRVDWDERERGVRETHQQMLTFG
jgi:hypothetical protein